MENFILSFRLDTPIVVMPRPPMLDSILAGELFERLRDPTEAIARVPIAKTAVGEVPMASQMLYGEHAEATLVARTLFRSFTRDLVRPDLAETTDLPRRIDTGRGEFQNASSTYFTADVDSVHFLARGDLARVEAIVRHVRFIGKQRRKGFGQVRDYRIETVGAALPLHGIVGDDRLLRPVPVRLAELLPETLRHGPIEMRTWTNPYLPAHGGPYEPCFVADMMMGEALTNEQLARMCAEPEPA